MSLDQINDYGIGDPNLTSLMETLDRQRRGYQAISLTHYDDALEPKIAAGSIVELGGALFKCEADESITGWAGIGNDNDVYIKLVPSGTTATAAFTTAAPTWSTSKQGWYVGNDRYIGGLYKDASGNYSYKWLYEEKPAQKSGLNVDVGMLAAFPFKNKPGWIWCDGSIISDTSDPEYARLVYLLKKEAGADAAHPFYHADADKAVLPDLRGAVIRGIDAAANRDKDGVRKSGAYQADENKQHTHTLNNATSVMRDLGDADPCRGTTTRTVSVITVNNQGAVEATMKNIALYYLIKY